MPRKSRASRAKTESQEELSAIADFVGDMSQEIRSDLVSPPVSEPDTPPLEEPVTEDVHQYLRRQVLIEMYGTETPDQYDQLVLSLKERMNRYGR